MKTQLIIGTLVPKESETITHEMGKKLHEGIIANELVPVISADRAVWDNKVRLNYAAVAEYGNHSPLDFIARLKSILWRVQKAGLFLDGEITVTVAGTDPVIYRIVVEDSELRYKKATVLWPNELESI